MSDCLIDCRPQEARQCDAASRWLTFFSDMQPYIIATESFSLTVTRADNPSLWGPYQDPQKNILVVLVGRLAMDECEWQEGEGMIGQGGLACKVIAHRYQRDGEAGLHELNGNYTVIVHDPARQKLLFVTDRCGMVPLFHSSAGGWPVFCSHPDLLAAVTGQATAFDVTSLAEFVSTGKVSFPFTYYQGIRALDTGSIHAITLKSNRPVLASSTRHFVLNYRPESQGSVESAAENLAEAFRSAVRRRTLPRLGTSAVALSGGLDSRMILCAAAEKTDVSAFCFFDRENLEFRTARAIAEALGVPFMPIPRDSEHYGRTAEQGIMIHGGMGSFANNHFLGFRDILLNAGFANVLTGFYCDYFFKGLALDRKHARWYQTPRPGPYSRHWYRPIFSLESPTGSAVRERQNDMFPIARQHLKSDRDRLWVEGQRIFPLAYEPDAAEALVPQRTIGWAPPIADNNVVDVYATLSVDARLTQAVYMRAVERICGHVVSRIPDSNTGARVNATGLDRVIRYGFRGLRNRYDRYIRPQLATSGSWPNWQYYMHHSPIIAALWHPENTQAEELLSTILGYNSRQRPIISYQGDEVELLARLLTLKIWLRVKPARL